MEHKESLQAIAVVGQPAELVHDGVDELLPNGVMTTSICGGVRIPGQSAHTKALLTVAGGIFLAVYERLRVEETLVGASSDLVDNAGLMKL